MDKNRRAASVILAVVLSLACGQTPASPPAMDTPTPSKFLAPGPTDTGPATSTSPIVSQPKDFSHDFIIDRISGYLSVEEITDEYAIITSSNGRYWRFDLVSHKIVLAVTVTPTTSP